MIKEIAVTYLIIKHGRVQEDVAGRAAVLDGCAAQDQGPRKTMEDTYILRNSLALSEFSWTGRPPTRSGLYAVWTFLMLMAAWHRSTPY